MVVVKQNMNDQKLEWKVSNRFYPDEDLTNCYTTCKDCGSTITDNTESIRCSPCRDLSNKGLEYHEERFEAKTKATIISIDQYGEKEYEEECEHCSEVDCDCGTMCIDCGSWKPCDCVILCSICNKDEQDCECEHCSYCEELIDECECIFCEWCDEHDDNCTCCWCDYCDSNENECECSWCEYCSEHESKCECIKCPYCDEFLSDYDYDCDKCTDVTIP